MKRRILPFVLLAAAFVSCQQEEISAPFVDDTTTTVLPPETSEIVNSDALALVALTGQTHISAEEAQETALLTATQMREVEGIVTKSPLQIASIEVIAENVRKPYIASKSSEQEQADMYVINFANNQGYVVTSADRRVPVVFAYNSHGSLGDAPSNPGQAILFEYIEDYVNQERENFEKNKETLIIEAQETIFKQLSEETREKLIKLGYFNKEGKRLKTKHNYDFFGSLCSEGGNGDATYEYGKIQTLYIKPPLLKTLWGQSGAYNNKVSHYCNADTDEAPVGCVATAVGQLMAYHKKPTVFKGRTMHWDDMTKIDAGDMFSSIYSHKVSEKPIAQEDIQHLLAKLGDADLLAMSYGCIADKGSSSNIEKAKNTLLKLGYSNVNITDYAPRLTIEEIKSNRPVYIRGSAFRQKHTHTTGWWFWKKSHHTYSYQDGHAWLLDGYVLREQDVTIYVEPCAGNPKNLPTIEVEHTKRQIELVHNNFGWGDSHFESKYGLGLDGSRANNTGWYHIGIFNTRGHKESSNTYKSGTENNFQYANKIITNIK